MTDALRIDIYSDTVCPWCYLGKHRFERALGARPRHEPRVTYRPFELNPDLPLEGVDRLQYLAAKIGDAGRIAALDEALVNHGREVGIDFRFDLIGSIPNTRRSHLLIAHAARRGLQATVKERLMQAYFEQGIDIGDIEELVRLACETGLDEHETRSMLVLRAGQDGVVAAERHAALLGITGVPTFVFNGQYTLSGAQDVVTFEKVLDQVAELAAGRDSLA